MKMPTVGPDRGEIVRALGLLFRPGDIVEARLLGMPGRGRIDSGYFDNPELLATTIVSRNGAGGLVYITLNPPLDCLLARSHNRIQPWAKVTTHDHEIKVRLNFGIDFDAVRPTGISSSDAEHEAAIARARQARQWLRDRGWPEPILADSGNGAHVVFRVELQNDQASRLLVQQCLAALAAEFDDEQVKVDQGVFNASRVWKLYGTVAGKGDATVAERPHRLAHIIEAPEALATVPLNLLHELAAEAPEPQTKSSKSSASPSAASAAGKFDVAAWLDKHGLAHGPGEPWKGGTRWILDECPFDPEHRGTSAAVLQHASGAISYRCLHLACEQHTWRELRAKFEPERNHVRPPTPAARELVTITLAEVTARQQEYLWDGYLPVDQLIALYGASHTAKTVLTQDLAARITTGSPWPDGSPNLLGPRKVLFLSAGEDALETVVKPRFALAGGDPSRLIIIKASRPVGSDVPLEEEMVALDRDADLLRQALTNDRGIVMTVIDPVTSHLGTRDHNAEKEVRPVLLRLRAIAEDLAVPGLIIGHLNRRPTGTTPFDRAMGARAFTGVPRTIYFAGADNTAISKHAFVLVQERGLGAKAWKYHTKLASTNVDGADVKQIQVVWDGTDDIRAEEVVDSVSFSEKTREQEAAEVLQEFLKAHDGEAPTPQCVERLEKTGYGSVNHARVRSRAGVGTRRGKKVGLQGTWYTMPTVDAVEPGGSSGLSVPTVLTEKFQQKNTTTNIYPDEGYASGHRQDIPVGTHRKDIPMDRNVSTCGMCFGTRFYDTGAGFQACADCGERVAPAGVGDVSVTTAERRK